jgi:hypothetical protein
MCHFLPLGNYVKHCSGTQSGYGEFTCFSSGSIAVCWTSEFEPRSWRGVLDTTLCDKVDLLPVRGFPSVL